MKIPVKWLKDYIDIPVSLKDFTDKMSIIGHMLDKLEETSTDTVIDLELRGNRADIFSIIGIARETKACYGGELKIPEVDYAKFNSLPGLKDFEIKIETPTVKRFYSCIIRNIKVLPSPKWLKEKLENYGMESINNIVDITNFVMIESGMPMHAFDLRYMGGQKLILRQARAGETVVTFDGSTLKLIPEDPVFAGEDGAVLGIPAIVGGKESGIHEDTIDILLECAGYDRVPIRKSMYRNKAITEAGLRHSHDLSFSYCDYALPRAAELILTLCPDSYIEGKDDYYPDPEKEITIEFDTDLTTRLGGVEIPVQEQKEILEKLEFYVEDSTHQSGVLIVHVPLFRTDINIPEDLVEEVLRIWGYDRIPVKTLSSEIPEPVTTPVLKIIDKTKNIFVSLGLDEIYTVPMHTMQNLSKVNDGLIDRIIPLQNPSSSDHDHMRTNLYTGLLLAAKKLIDGAKDEVKMFETGRIYLRKDPKNPIHQLPHKPEFPYVEFERGTGIIISKKNKIDFYEIKGLIEAYFNELEIKDLVYKKITHPSYALCAEIYQNDVKLGEIGILSSEVVNKNFDIEGNAIGFDLYLDEITKAKTTTYSYKSYSPYPEVKQAMSVLVDRKVISDEVIKTLIENGEHLVREIKIGDVYESGGKRSILFDIIYQSKNKTLTTEEVNNLHIKLENLIREKFNAKIRGRDDLVQVTNQTISKLNPEVELSKLNPQDNLAPIKQKEELSKLPEENNLTIVNQPILPSDKIIIGRIIEITKHPNADKLVLCKVYIGDGQITQIVTGAENIKPGIAENKIIPVAMPGAIVKSHKTGEIFEIKAAELRGEMSNGMLCSRLELDVKDGDQSGIWILDEAKYKDHIGENLLIKIQ